MLYVQFVRLELPSLLLDEWEWFVLGTELRMLFIELRAVSYAYKGLEMCD